MKLSLICLTLILWSSLSPAQSGVSPLCQDNSDDRYYEDLPSTLKMDYLERAGFVLIGKPSPELTKGTLRPLNEDAPLNGFVVEFPGTDKPKSFSTKDRSKAFLEDEWAMIPEGSQIRRIPDPKFKEAWDFPTNTQIVHRIFFNDHPEPKIFEFRIIKKQQAGDWAFGVYRFDEKTNQLVLITDEQSDAAAKSRSYALKTRMDHEVQVSVGHTGTKSCRMCHQEPEERYACARVAGPEKFVPGNREVEEEWVKNFMKKYPRSPFADARTPAAVKKPKKK